MQALEGLSQSGCIWHITSIRHAPHGQETDLLIQIIGKPEELLHVSALDKPLLLLMCPKIVDVFWLVLLHSNKYNAFTDSVSTSEWIGECFGDLWSQTANHNFVIYFNRTNYGAVILCRRMTNGVFGKWKEAMHEGQVWASFIQRDWLHVVG